MNSDRPWLAQYAPGVPAEINPDEYASIVAVLDSAIASFRDRPAFSSFGKVLTYADIDRLSSQLAAYLLGELELKRGDRVAIMMPNCLQYPISTFGILRAGLTVVNVNPLYTPRELKHQLVDSGASAIIVLDNFGHTVQEVIAQTQVRQVITTGLGDLVGGAKGAIMNFVLKHIKKMVPRYELPGAIRFREALGLGQMQEVPEVTIDSGDIAFLQYTGGTTGTAKGAMLTHRNLVANMEQAAAWVGGNLKPGEELIITALPLYHIFSLTANGLVFTKFGGLNHLITNPRDMKGFVKELKGTKFTAITGVNTLFNGLLNTPGFDEVDFSSLRMTLGGGMAVQRAVADRWKKVTGCTLVEAYGLTETSPAACINPMDLPAYNGSIGLPVPSTDACVKDEDGNILPVGEIGELCIKGPQVMKGYWNRPEETAAAIDTDGWLHTGDMARMDEKGYFYIVDRKKDMILVSGFNVYPNEIEDVLAGMPGVLEVAAVGVPDEKSGETVKVVIVRKDPKLTAEDVLAGMPGVLEVAAVGVPDEKSGETVKVVIVRKDPGLTAEDVKAFAREQLTGYKRPHVVEFRNELPKTNVGKILRRELREDAAGS